jgi:hypothetical protein
MENHSIKISLFPLYLIGLVLCSSVSAMFSMDQTEASFNLHADVDMVTIEVHALDSKGKPAHRLKKEDFRLYEDGKEQEIISFDVVRDRIKTLKSPLPLPQSEDTHPPKTVMILFDDSTIPEK